MYIHSYKFLHIIVYLCIFWHESLHSCLLQKCFEHLFSTTGPFQGHTLPFQGKSFLFQGSTVSFQGHNNKEKGRKVQNYYILLFLRNKLLNSTLLSGFKFGWSIGMILYIAGKHEFQIAHIPIWTSVLDVDMKSCPSARVTYPPSCPVPHRGEGV